MEKDILSLPDYFFSNIPADEIIEFIKSHTKKYDDMLPKSSFVICSCGSDKVWVDNLQTRSGDEGFTCFFKCSLCKKRWTAS